MSVKKRRKGTIEVDGKDCPAEDSRVERVVSEWPQPNRVAVVAADLTRKVDSRQRNDRGGLDVSRGRSCGCGRFLSLGPRAVVPVVPVASGGEGALSLWSPSSNARPDLYSPTDLHLHLVLHHSVCMSVRWTWTRTGTPSHSH